MDEIEQIARERQGKGITEVHIVGGVHPDPVSYTHLSGASRQSRAASASSMRSARRTLAAMSSMCRMLFRGFPVEVDGDGTLPVTPSNVLML